MAGASPYHCHVLYKPKDYEIDEIIGCGTFSEVVRATHIETRAVIALKLFRHKMRSMASYRAAAKEIALLEILEHPHILRLQLYEINKTYVYIGTEFAAFGCLRRFLLDKRPIAESIIKYVMKQLLTALSYLHEMGIFHGDVKPDNILCSDMAENGPIIKLADFGLSEIKLKGNDRMVYKSGSFLYMAPEVHLRYPVDCSCDLWSAGVIMYIMMFAKNIFNFTEKEREKHLSYIKHKTEPNYDRCERYSVECNDLIRQLLTYDKEKRITGERLRRHPFLDIPSPVIPAAETFLAKAEENIKSAFKFARDKKYGEALVQGTKAVMMLKIHHNVIDDAEKQKHIRKKWLQYEEFTYDMERALVQPDDFELTCPEKCSNSDLRRYLASTPKLLDGYDIGCSAEMFLKEGQNEKAIAFFHQALQMLLPLMKTEPRSNRKELLGKRLKEWIESLETLIGTNDGQDEAAAAAAAPNQYQLKEWIECLESLTSKDAAQDQAAVTSAAPNTFQLEEQAGPVPASDAAASNAAAFNAAASNAAASDAAAAASAGASDAAAASAGAAVVASSAYLHKED